MGAGQWRLRLMGTLALAAVMVRGATAQGISPDTTTANARPAEAGRPPGSATTAHLDTVVVTQGRTTSLVGPAVSASQGVVGAADLALRPLLRPAEVVENVPGVIVTQHSGSGKANQYFLRGFNLDHGTDLALSADGVPVNMPSHAHGQGYADLNFIIPELIQDVEFKKGPYYADVGDFGSAGAFNIRYYDQLPEGLAIAEGGQVGFGRLLVANNAPVAGGNLLYAGQLEHNDGPWDIPDNSRNLNGVLRYAAGTPANAFTLTAMGYHNDWHSTDQVPDRAIKEGLIDRWGAIDSTDGGNTARYSLTGDWQSVGTNSMSNALVYALHYDLDLFSNFTYFLMDPIHGDQIEQHDNRSVFGGKVSHTLFGTLFSVPSQNTIGFQIRNDDIENGLYHTEARERLNPVTVNWINETSAAPWFENRTTWTDWLRTMVGLRGDLFWFNVQNVTGGNSGSPSEALFSPKVGVIAGPWSQTEVYFDAGDGYHSNDARGIVSHIDPATALPRSFGSEVGARTAMVPGLQSSVSFWLLDLQSELVWDADVGGSEPSGPTRRYGIELANYYTPVSWVNIDADYAYSIARYTDYEADGQYVPEALVATFDGGVAVHVPSGTLQHFGGGVRLRYFGPRPLTQNDSVSSKATTLVYLDLGYDFSKRWSIGLDVFNLFNTYASDIDYYYVSRLPGEPLAGVADIHTHPAEPREIRLLVTARW
jgi:TonB dependent receptor/TonB-dependent Receptor Plug Domain